MDETCRRKLVIVGDSSCGKTSLLRLFCKDASLEADNPTVLGFCDTVLRVDGHDMRLALMDTACRGEYDRLRPLSYPNVDVVLIAFSIGSPGSLWSVQKEWIEEVQHFSAGSPIILVGCKKDLRHDSQTIKELGESKQKPVTYTEGEKVGREIAAYKYLECSVNANEGVSEVLEQAARAAFQRRVELCGKPGPCSIL